MPAPLDGAQQKACRKVQAVDSERDSRGNRAACTAPVQQARNCTSL